MKSGQSTPAEQAQSHKQSNDIKQPVYDSAVRADDRYLDECPVQDGQNQDVDQKGNEHVNHICFSLEPPLDNRSFLRNLGQPARYVGERAVVRLWTMHNAPQREHGNTSGCYDISPQLERTTTRRHEFESVQGEVAPRIVARG